MMVACLKKYKTGNVVSKTIGYHLIADLRTEDAEENAQLSDLIFMQNLLVRAAKAAGAICLKVEGHKFGKEQGITAFVMLAESHISVHSWPEHGYAALDIFMCGTSVQNIEKAVGVIKTRFPAAEITEKILKRDYLGK